MLIIYIVIALYTLGHNGAKAETHVFIEDVEVKTIDPEYFDPDSTERFVTEERTVGTNWTIVKKFPPETMSAMKMLGYSMGGYTIPTGSKMQWPFCELVRNVMMEEYFTLLGIFYDSCPPEPGNYFVASHIPATDHLPTGIPDNRYLAICEIAVAEKILYRDDVYFEIQNY